MLDTSNLEDDYLRDNQEYIDKGVVREEFLTQARKPLTKASHRYSIGGTSALAEIVDQNNIKTLRSIYFLSVWVYW